MPGARDLQGWARQKGLVMLDSRGLQRQEDRSLLLWDGLRHNPLTCSLQPGYGSHRASQPTGLGHVLLQGCFVFISPDYMYQHTHTHAHTVYCL